MIARDLRSQVMRVNETISFRNFHFHYNGENYGTKHVSRGQSSALGLNCVFARRQN